MRPEYIIDFNSKNGTLGASELGYDLRSPFLWHLDKFLLIRIPRRWKEHQLAVASYSFNVFPPPIQYSNCVLIAFDYNIKYKNQKMMACMQAHIFHF